MNFEALMNPPPKPDKVKDIKLEEAENLSIENLRYRNMERHLKISDMEGISDFSESPDGNFISYVTKDMDNNKLKVFDRQTDSVKTLHTANSRGNDTSDLMINAGLEKLKTYRVGNNFNEFALGYQRKGEFVVQKLSHSSQSGEILLTMKSAGMFNASYLLSKDRRSLISQHRADVLDFNDLESGTAESIYLGFTAFKIIDSEEGSLAIAMDRGKLAVFDKDKKQVFEKLESKDYSFGSASVIDENSFVVSQGENLVFYEIKDGNYEKSKELNIGFDSDKIIESVDKKYLFCRAAIASSHDFFVIEKETGKIISKIESQHIQQNWRGDIAVLNQYGAIEQYNLQDKPKTRDNTQKIAIAEKGAVHGKDEYSLFKNWQAETIKGVSWNQYENLISRELKRKGEFEWGRQRIYLEVPLSKLENVKDIVIDISIKENMPIQFKFIDQEKSDMEMVKDATRFVLNFKNIEDAKKFYNSLSQNESYKDITPDRDKNYHGYKLDDKTSYASGFTEYREEDLQNLEEWKKNFTKNPDGSYSSILLDIETGKSNTISAEEYQNMIDGKNPATIAKKNWEKV